MRLFFTLLFLTSINLSFSQNRDEVLAEAYQLYNSEKASWHGTDLFLDKFPERKNRIGGYISYSDNNGNNCLFFDKEEVPNTLVKFTFNDNFNIKSAKIDTTKRKLNKLEVNLKELRKKAIKEITTDTLFKQYKNINFNIVPLINGNKKKVIILSGPKSSGVVIFGNDYSITFDKKNNVIKKKALHKNIIPIEYNIDTKESVSMHSHLKSSGSLISSTDLCTLMLYRDSVNWSQHYVISKKKVSIWDIKQNELLIMSRKAWEKLSNTKN